MTSKARRDCLRDVNPFKSNRKTHIGLWMDRYLAHQTKILDNNDGKDATQKLLSEISDRSRRIPDGYERAFKRRQESFFNDSLGENNTTYLLQDFEATGRLVVGFGDSGVLENGLALEHTWGVPILPGPSLKGVAAAAAHHLLPDSKESTESTESKKSTWSKTAGSKDVEDPTYAEILFGFEQMAGLVTFHDAWWVPNEDNWPIHSDILTVHNQSYYDAVQGTIPPPKGTDNPNPVQFVSSSGKYLVALSASQEAAELGWLETAMEILTIGLTQLGIGAKTSAGYGYLQPVNNPDNDIAKHQKESAKQSDMCMELEQWFDSNSSLSATQKYRELKASDWILKLESESESVQWAAWDIISNYIKKNKKTKVWLDEVQTKLKP